MSEATNRTMTSDRQGPGIERLTGHGVVYRAGSRVAETDYDLMVTPRDAGAATFGPGQDPTNVPEITGRLLGAFYQSESMTGVMTLVLEDGRAFDFQVLQPDINEIASISSIKNPRPLQGTAERKG